MADAVLPTAAQLVLLDEMKEVRDDWENPMHSWVALVAALASKNPFRISRMIRLAKTSPWTRETLDKELNSELGRTMMLDCMMADYAEDCQKAYDLEEAENWLEAHPNDIAADVPLKQTEKEQRAHDAKQWELMHPPRYPEEVASTQVVFEAESEDSDEHQSMAAAGGSSDGSLF